MTRSFTCDKCKRSFDYDENTFQTPQVEARRNLMTLGSSRLQKIDLCLDCDELFEFWLNEPIQKRTGAVGVNEK